MSLIFCMRFNWSYYFYCSRWTNQRCVPEKTQKTIISKLMRWFFVVPELRTILREISRFAIWITANFHGFTCFFPAVYGYSNKLACCPQTLSVFSIHLCRGYSKDTLREYSNKPVRISQVRMWRGPQNDERSGAFWQLTHAFSVQTCHSTQHSRVLVQSWHSLHKFHGLE